MIARYAIGIAALLASTPVLAESLDATAAQRLVLGKLFAHSLVLMARAAQAASMATAPLLAPSSSAARDPVIQYGCRQERSRLKARRSALRLTACRLSRALI